jgi:hypothetical protein
MDVTPVSFCKQGKSWGPKLNLKRDVKQNLESHTAVSFCRLGGWCWQKQKEVKAA